MASQNRFWAQWELIAHSNHLKGHNLILMLFRGRSEAPPLAGVSPSPGAGRQRDPGPT